MIASLSVILSLFGAGFVLMIRELRKAPIAIEDESGFRVVREAPAASPRSGRQPATARGMRWAFHRA
jgi:hypothetical protein